MTYLADNGWEGHVGEDDEEVILAVEKGSMDEKN